MISIVIPVHNQHEMTAACLDAIRAHTRDYEIIIVDNGSYPSIEAQDARIIRLEANKGFPHAVNLGIFESSGDVVVVLNNDVIVTPGWADGLLAHLESYDMVGPLTNSVSGPQQTMIDFYGDQDGLNAAAVANSEKNKGKITPHHRLVFFCVAIRRTVIDKIGILDEVFSPGNYEDDDYCMRAIETGFRVGYAHDVYVHHFGSVTHHALNIDYQNLLTKNRSIFDAKWDGKYESLKAKAVQNG